MHEAWNLSQKSGKTQYLVKPTWSAVPKGKLSDAALMLPVGFKIDVQTMSYHCKVPLEKTETVVLVMNISTKIENLENILIYKTE